MRTPWLPLLAFAACLVASGAPGAAAQPAAPGRPLHITFIDVEGGQATLIVAPSGESLLVDAGWPGFDGRDADRIVAAAKAAGVSRIDYLVVTHYHTDHVGGVPALAAKLPIGTFVDHGETVEHDPQGEQQYQAYLAVRAKGTHLLAKPGGTIPIKGLDVRIVTAAGDRITTPLPGVTAAPNALCADFTPRAPDPGENARSVGLIVTLGRFRFADLGDLTWNKEHDLVCPANVLGTVDLYLTTHHGLDQSNAPVIVHALKPRVAVMNNGATKGGSPAAWQTVHDSPGLQDLWQLHHAEAGGADHNVAAARIANPDTSTSYAVVVEARPDGSFTVTNTRNGQRREYGPRPSRGMARAAGRDVRLRARGPCHTMADRRQS